MAGTSGNSVSGSYRVHLSTPAQTLNTDLDDSTCRTFLGTGGCRVTPRYGSMETVRPRPRAAFSVPQQFRTETLPRQTVSRGLFRSESSLSTQRPLNCADFGVKWVNHRWVHTKGVIALQSQAQWTHRAWRPCRSRRLWALGRHEFQRSVLRLAQQPNTSRLQFELRLMHQGPTHDTQSKMLRPWWGCSGLVRCSFLNEGLCQAFG